MPAIDQATIIAARRSQVEDVTASSISRLKSIGATNIKQYWMVASVAASVPAAAVADIATWSGVITVEHDVREFGNDSAYGGNELRSGLKTDAFIAAGFKAQAYNFGSAGSHIKVAEMEGLSGSSSTNWLNNNHPGLWTSGGAAYRFMKAWDCTTGTCSVHVGNGGNTEHVNAVMQIMAGSIEDSQDPSITVQSDRIERSGGAPVADMYQYAPSGTCSSWIAALQQALTDSIDVLNISAHLQCSPSGYCPAACDCGGFNAAMASATDGGMVIVASAGNSGNAGTTCDMDYPGIRRETLSVGATASTNSTVPYDSAGVASYSARGGMPVTIVGVYPMTPYSGSYSSIDVVVPGDHTYWYLYDGSYGYDTTTIVGGTSYSAPVASGAVALMRQALGTAGWSYGNAHAVLINTLLLADGWGASSGMDNVAGAGRLHMHWPSATNLGTGYGWGWHSVRMYQGQTVSYPVGGGFMSASAQEWKLAMTSLEWDYTKSSDIDVEVDSFASCSPPSGASTFVWDDTSTDMRSRIRLNATQVASKCLQYKLYGYSVPAEGRVVYVADFYRLSTAD